MLEKELSQMPRGKPNLKRMGLWQLLEDARTMVVNSDFPYYTAITVMPACKLSECKLYGCSLYHSAIITF